MQRNARRGGPAPSAGVALIEPCLTRRSAETRRPLSVGVFHVLVASRGARRRTGETIPSSRAGRSCRVAGLPVHRQPLRWPSLKGRAPDWGQRNLTAGAPRTAQIRAVSGEPGRRSIRPGNRAWYRETDRRFGGRCRCWSGSRREATVRRIDTGHANAKRHWQEMGSPEYLDAAAVAELHT